MGGPQAGSLAGGFKKQCYVILRRIPDVEDSSAGFCEHGNEQQRIINEFSDKLGDIRLQENYVAPWPLLSRVINMQTFNINTPHVLR
jgi:hypothetical protein